MRRKKIIITTLLLICLSFLSSCRSASQSSTGELEDISTVTENIDAQNYWAPDGSIGRTENGYYMWDLMDMKIDFWDKNSKKLVPLCNKPECTHSRENTDCNAYFPESKYVFGKLWCYGNSVFVLEKDTDGLYLTQISSDGNIREKLCKLSENKEASVRVILHRGFAYFSMNDLKVEKETEQSVYRVALEKNAEPELIDKFSGLGSTYAGIKGYGDKIYMLRCWVDGEYNEEDLKLKHELWDYNIESGEKNLLSEENMFTYDVDQNTQKIYYSVIGDNMYQMNLDGSGKELFYDTKGSFIRGTVSVDGNYIYLDNSMSKLVDLETDDKLYVFDKNGNKVNEVIKDPDAVYLLVNGDENYMFAEKECGWIYLDKKKNLQGDGSQATKWTQLQESGE